MGETYATLQGAIPYLPSLFSGLNFQPAGLERSPSGNSLGSSREMALAGRGTSLTGPSVAPDDASPWDYIFWGRRALEQAGWTRSPSPTAFPSWPDFHDRSLWECYALIRLSLKQEPSWLPPFNSASCCHSFWSLGPPTPSNQKFPPLTVLVKTAVWARSKLGLSSGSAEHAETFRLRNP